jgi:hypothetical protein
MHVTGTGTHGYPIMSTTGAHVDVKSNSYSRGFILTA